MGESRLATLDSFLQRPLSFRALRRARLRNDGLKVGDLSLDRWVEDLEAVVAAADPQGPFALLGISQGGPICVAYAVKHPERVSHLILYGAYARGALRRGDPDRESFYRAMIDLVRLEWGSDNPTFRQVFTSRFIPGGTDEQLGWFNDLCRKTLARRSRPNCLIAGYARGDSAAR